MRLQETLVKDNYTSSSQNEEMFAIYEAVEHIQAKYYGTVNDTDFTDEVIAQMITQLDPYSHYFEAQNSSAYSRFMTGIYEGIGVEIKSRDSAHYVFRVMPNSPAQKAGLSRGDKIVQVADIQTEGVFSSIDSLIYEFTSSEEDSLYLELYKINGTNQKVTLQVMEVDQPLIEDFVIQTSPDQTTSYVKIHRFYTNVFRDFMETLEEHEKEHGAVSHLIMDVRGNPGGVVEETVKILNQLFEEKGLLLLSTKYRNGPEKEYKSNGRGFISIDRVVILCDENSASASEILAGVIQDYDRGVIIGENTFGKGVIQQNYKLENDASLHLTVGEYILPTGRLIHSANRSDTMFSSLINERPLKSLNGIPVDLDFENCGLTRGQKTKLNDQIIERKLWTAADVVAYLGAKPFDLTDRPCSKALNANKAWYLYKKTLSNGAKVDGLIDPLMSYAQELIWSDEYDVVLGQESASSNNDQR